jgi:hypothetical protein
MQNGSTMSCQSILNVQSCKLDHWLPSYGVDLIADDVRATLTLSVESRLKSDLKDNMLQVQ